MRRTATNLLAFAASAVALAGTAEIVATGSNTVDATASPTPSPTPVHHGPREKPVIPTVESGPGDPGVGTPAGGHGPLGQPTGPGTGGGSPGGGLPGGGYGPGPDYPIDLGLWLGDHTKVANAIRWQEKIPEGADETHYVPPTKADTIEYGAWSYEWREELQQSYLGAADYLAQGAKSAIELPYEGVTDLPANLDPDATSGPATVQQWMSDSDMWHLYLANVAFTLALETSGKLPWSLTSYGDDDLALLLDSTRMAWKERPFHSSSTSAFVFGSYLTPNVPMRPDNLRVHNLPLTAFTHPQWTYHWLRKEKIQGKTRRESIENLLDWMRANMDHFVGGYTYANFEASWHYRGFVPLSRITHGTVVFGEQSLGERHWTAGCHGSVGFLNEVLRALDIPVQPVWVSNTVAGGHELPFFPTEHLYMDHGDDPYNQIVKAQPNVPIGHLLIDEKTFEQQFGTQDVTKNVLDASPTAFANIGLSAQSFH